MYPAADIYQEAQMQLWQGRVDSDETGPALRWHQQVQPYREEDAYSGVVLLGICSDEGVRRNLGRTGARLGPDAIRRALADLAWHLERPLFDAGNLICQKEDLETLSCVQADLVEALLKKGHFPLLLGGGHEIAFGSFRGLKGYLQSQHNPTKPQIGIVNFDAHFDLRLEQQPSSGTSFLQIAELCAKNDLTFHYCCLGISETANTQDLFQRAEELGVMYLKDEALTPWLLPQVEQRLVDFLAPLDALYLTIDLDVLPASCAPGVSAPAARGLPLGILEHLLAFIKARMGPRLMIADIAEYNPTLDIDDRTSRVAARLCHLITRPEHPPKEPR